MPVIIEGGSATFCGNMDTIFAAKDAIDKAVEKCKDKKRRKEFIKNLKSNKDEREWLGTSFALIKGLYGLNPEQIECYNHLKEYLKT